jgi:hypothetical protein
MQAVGRGRAICEGGIPVAVLTNENLGFPILELKIDTGRVNDSDTLVVSVLCELSALSATGEQDGTEDPLSALPANIYLAGRALSSDATRCPIPLSAIAEEAGLSSRTTIKILNRLLARNLVVKHRKRGGWSLPISEPKKDI